MRTKFNAVLADWRRVKNHCRTTVGKEFTDSEPSPDFKAKLLISEHSPVRLIEVDWSWTGIKSWVATHWSRHKFEKFISTQRDDRVKDRAVSRDAIPQSAPVNFDGFANAQQLIDVFRKRLCKQAHAETREYAIDFKHALTSVEPELALMLVPNCIYRYGCPEFKPCGHFEAFRLWCDSYLEGGLDERNMLDIKTRYVLYNIFLHSSEYRTIMKLSEETKQ